MKLRIAVVVLALVAVVSISTAAYLYNSLKTSALAESESQAISEIEILKNRIDSFLSENLKTVKVMAGIKEIRQALAAPEAKELEGANQILDHFQKALGVDVCYLMDRQGKTIASSNRNATDSFVGKDFHFRPYFQEANQGRPSVYMALGTTTKVPGAYYSYPVYKEGEKSPLGVAVIKASVGAVEAFFRLAPRRITFLMDPHGIIFISSSKEWLYRFLWKPEVDVVAELEKTQQFGKGPWEWSGFVKQGDGLATDRSGYDYLVHQTAIENYPGWSVVTLNSAGHY